MALAQRLAQTPPCDSAAGERLGAETLRGEDLDACKHFEVRPIVRVDARHTVTKHGGGESAAAELVAKLGSKAEIARELAYRLYTLCERKRRAAEALSYNGLVQSWPEITRLAREGSKPRGPEQQELL